MTLHIKRILNGTVVPLLGFILILLTSLTVRVRVTGEETARLVDENSVILAFWHSRIFYMPWHFRWQSKWQILVSPSSDGDIIAGILMLFGFNRVRGSSFQSPTRALLALAKRVRKGASAAMIADGSRGPANVAQQGSAALAKLTGRPVVPIAFGAEKMKRLNSWDKTIIPLPFTRINMVYGNPVYVDRRAGEKELEEKRAELEKELNRITAIADSFSP